MKVSVTPVTAGVSSQSHCGQTISDCARLRSPGTCIRPLDLTLRRCEFLQVIMFGVMPTWTDMLGAGLVLVTVISIPFEKFINSKLCPVASEEDCDEQDRTVDNDVKKEHFNDKV